jgi:hypothetical protein
MCIGDMAVLGGDAGTLAVGGPCPKFPHSKPIALVTVEKPILIYLGFAILLLAFLLQLLSRFRRQNH